MRSPGRISRMERTACALVTPSQEVFSSRSRSAMHQVCASVFGRKCFICPPLSLWDNGVFETIPETEKCVCPLFEMEGAGGAGGAGAGGVRRVFQIGRAACRGRGEIS